MQEKIKDDTISRQAAIDAMEQAKEQYFDRKVIIGKMQDIVNNLPPAQPEERTEERTETHACDCISRQAAIELATQYCPDDDGTCSKADEDIRNLLDELEALPSAQPERKKGKWVTYDGDWFKTMFKCSECGAMIDIDEKDRNFFCYHCGADMRGEQDG